jgi:hypothetical protein
MSKRLHVARGVPCWCCPAPDSLRTVPDSFSNSSANSSLTFDFAAPRAGGLPREAGGRLPVPAVREDPQAGGTGGGPAYPAPGGSAAHGRRPAAGERGGAQEPGGEPQAGESLRAFIRIYRPHEAREDTVLLPAFRTIMTPNEYPLPIKCSRFKRKEKGPRMCPRHHSVAHALGWAVKRSILLNRRSAERCHSEPALLTTFRHYFQLGSASNRREPTRIRFGWRRSWAITPACSSRANPKPNSAGGVSGRNSPADGVPTAHRRSVPARRIERRRSPARVDRAAPRGSGR